MNTVSIVISLPLLIGVIIVLLLIGFAAWYAIRRRQRPQATNREVLEDALGAWHEATCPVCLCLGAVDRLQIHTHEH